MEHELYEQKKMANFILKMRKVRNLTQKDLAEKLGVTEMSPGREHQLVVQSQSTLNTYIQVTLYRLYFVCV